MGATKRLVFELLETRDMLAIVELAASVSAVAETISAEELPFDAAPSEEFQVEHEQVDDTVRFEAEIVDDGETVPEVFDMLPELDADPTSDLVADFETDWYFDLPVIPNEGILIDVELGLFAMAIPTDPAAELQEVLDSVPTLPADLWHSLSFAMQLAVPETFSTTLESTSAPLDDAAATTDSAPFADPTPSSAEVKSAAIATIPAVAFLPATTAAPLATTEGSTGRIATNALDATATTSSATVLEGWQRIFSHAKRPFEWSTLLVLFCLACSASTAFGQGYGRSPLDEAAQRRARLRAGVLHRPLPPIKSSTSSTPSSDVDADEVRTAATTAATTAAQPSTSVGSGVTRQVQYQEAYPQDLGIELPAEMQSQGMIYDQGSNYDPSGMTYMEGAPGNFGQRSSQRNAGPLWFRAEYLLWWMEGFSTPPLVTTSTDGTVLAEAGIPGLASTSILYGGEPLEDDSRSGGRFSLGGWFDQDNTIGLQASYFALNGSNSNYAATSPGTPIIARPFFNIEPGLEGNDAELIAFPGLLIGSVNVSSSSSLQGLEVLMRGTLAQNHGWRVDGLLGYRYQRLKEGLAISGTRTVIGTGTGLAVGTTFEEFDQFNASNEFHGGDIGFLAAYRGRAWSLETTLKLAIGANKQSVSIAGQSRSTVPNGNPPVVTSDSGLLAQSTNIGTYSNTELAILPEVGATVGYCFTPNLRGTVGYTFMYWTDVVRPGTQIDPDLNLSQLVGRRNGVARPEFHRTTENLWIQGMNVGLDYSF